MLAGNTVVIKPADQTPLSAILLGEVVREALPPGVVSIVTGDATTGQALVTDDQIRRIAFTGSAATGRRIQSAASRSAVRHLTLELGGKNAMVVFPDVDIAEVVENVVYGMNLRANAGQSCGSTSRVFVHRAIYDEFRDQLTRRFAALSLGRSYDPDTEVGPVIDDGAAARIEGYVERAMAEGAALMTGGPADPRKPSRGSYVAPTVLAEVSQRFEVAREEIFGPVVAMLPWDDVDTMVHDVNYVDYGLTASVWTNDLANAIHVSREVEAGYVWVNDSTKHYFGMPFGGWKESGLGKEECIGEYQDFLREKSVNISLARTAGPWR